MLEELLERLLGSVPTTIREREELEQETEPDEVRAVRVQFRDEETGQHVITAEVRAEVRRKPTFGFNPRRERIQVRISLPPGTPALPPRGVTLLENEQPFGAAQGWNCRAPLPPTEQGTVNCLLED